MSVVFDEVTATVETPGSESSAPQEDDNGQDTENPGDSVLQLIETQKRRFKRLWAD